MDGGAARLILTPTSTCRRRPTCRTTWPRCWRRGSTTWRRIPVTPDDVNPERPWPALDVLRAATEAAGYELAPRLTIYPELALAPERWLDPALRPAVLAASDAHGLGRDLDGWYAGGEPPPPRLLPSFPAAGGRVAEVLAGVVAGQEVGQDEIVALFGARGREVAAVAEVADDLRRRIVGDTVTWVANRNINYTNVCTFKCRFCAFSKGPLSLNLRGDPYLLGVDEIQRRVVEAVDLGATEVCLQGGIHPSFDGDYYIDVCRAVKDVAPGIHVHGFTALEVTEGAKRLGEPLVHVSQPAEGRGSCRPCPAPRPRSSTTRSAGCCAPTRSPPTSGWRRTGRRTPSACGRTSPSCSGPSSSRCRGPATCCAPATCRRRRAASLSSSPCPSSTWPRRCSCRAGPAWVSLFLEALLMHAVARIAYRELVPNVQVSWVKMGVVGSRQALMAGANDLGGTLIDENISRAAGASHGQRMAEDDFQAIVDPLGRPLRQRTTLYGTVGGLRPPTTPRVNCLDAPSAR